MTATAKPLPIKHFSHSSRSLYADCGKKWEFKYVHRLPEEPVLAMRVGSTNHAILAGINNWIKDKKTAPDKPHFVQVVKDLVEVSLPLEVFKDEKPGNKAEEAMSNEAFMMHCRIEIQEQLQAIAMNYIDVANVNFKEVVLVETGHLVDIEGVPFQTYVDLVVRVVGGALKVIDYKTKRQSGGEPDILQLVSYHISTRDLLKVSPDGLEQWDLVRKKKTELIVRQVDMAKFDEYERVLREEIKTAWAAVHRGYFPRNMRSMFCGPGKCEFWDSCMNPTEFEKRRETTAEFHGDLVEGLEARRS